jgi:hypothetical protein
MYEYGDGSGRDWIGRCKTGGIVLSDRSPDDRLGDVGGVGITVDEDSAESESESTSVAWEGDDCSSDSSS